MKIQKIDGQNIEQINQVKDIFYEASFVKNFKSETHKEEFFNKWCGDYLHYYPEFFYVLIKDLKVAGYLCGCSNTLQSLEKLVVPGLNNFQDLYLDFPAHFHININSNNRGEGLGQNLVNHFFIELKKLKINGVHIVTSKDAKNVEFYKKLNFNEVTERDLNGFSQLFMGHFLMS